MYMCCTRQTNAELKTQKQLSNGNGGWEVRQWIRLTHKHVKFTAYKGVPLVLNLKGQLQSECKL